MTISGMKETREAGCPVHPDATINMIDRGELTIAVEEADGAQNARTGHHVRYRCGECGTEYDHKTPEPIA